MSVFPDAHLEMDSDCEPLLESSGFLNIEAGTIPRAQPRVGSALVPRTPASTQDEELRPWRRVAPCAAVLAIAGVVVSAALAASDRGRLLSPVSSLVSDLQSAAELLSDGVEVDVPLPEQVLVPEGYNEAKATALAVLAKVGYCDGAPGYFASATYSCGQTGLLSVKTPCEDSDFVVVPGSVRSLLSQGQFGGYVARFRSILNPGAPQGSVVSFRGSFDNKEDADRDSANNLVPALPFLLACPGAKLHQGLFEAWIKLQISVLQLVGHQYDGPVVCTAHGSGGALCALLMYQMKLMGYQVLSSYVFSMPAVGNEAFAKCFDSAFSGPSKLYRITNEKDLSCMPPGEMYRHVGIEVHYPNASKGHFEVCEPARNTPCGCASYTDAAWAGRDSCQSALAPEGSFCAFASFPASCYMGTGFHWWAFGPSAGNRALPRPVGAAVIGAETAEEAKAAADQALSSVPSLASRLAPPTPVASDVEVKPSAAPDATKEQPADSLASAAAIIEALKPLVPELQEQGGVTDAADLDTPAESETPATAPQLQTPMPFIDHPVLPPIPTLAPIVLPMAADVPPPADIPPTLPLYVQPETSTEEPVVPGTTIEIQHYVPPETATPEPYVTPTTIHIQTYVPPEPPTPEPYTPPTTIQIPSYVPPEVVPYVPPTTIQYVPPETATPAPQVPPEIVTPAPYVSPTTIQVLPNLLTETLHPVAYVLPTAVEALQPYVPTIPLTEDSPAQPNSLPVINTASSTPLPQEIPPTSSASPASYVPPVIPTLEPYVPPATAVPTAAPYVPEIVTPAPYVPPEIVTPAPYVPPEIVTPAPPVLPDAPKISAAFVSVDEPVSEVSEPEVPLVPAVPGVLPVETAPVPAETSTSTLLAGSSSTSSTPTATKVAPTSTGVRTTTRKPAATTTRRKWIR